MSTPNPDRYEEIVEPKAFKRWLKTFLRNPVLIAGHQYVGRSGEPTVIGHWLSVEITPEGLVATCQFANTPLAEEYWQLFRDKHMRAFSVGWITHAWEMREFELSPGVKKQIRVFTEVELIEISAVAIPANRESLVRAAAAGIDPEAVAKLIDAHIEKAVAKAIAKHLDPTDPGGHLSMLISDVVAACAGHVDHSHDDGHAPPPGDGGPGEPAPGRMAGLLRQLA